MRSIKSSLETMERSLSPENPGRLLLAALIKAAGMREDLFARSSYLEGLIGYSPGSLSKNPMSLSAAREALASGSENKIVDTLRHIKGMADRDIHLMLGVRDTGLFDSVMNGTSAAMSGPVRGLMPEDVAMAITAGISPITGGPLKYGRGKGVFFHLGETAPKTISLIGIKRIAFLEAKNRAADVVRGTRKEERGTVSLDAPIGTGEDTTTLSDILQGDGGVSRGDFVDLAEAVYRDPAVMGMIDSDVKSQLKTPLSHAVWDVIRHEPDLIIVGPDGKMGVDQRDLAKKVAEATGTPYIKWTSDVAAGKVFRDSVLPAMRDALFDSGVADKLLQQKHILEVIQDATRKAPSREHVHVSPSYSPGDSRSHEPSRTPMQSPKPVRTPAWLQRLKHDPDLKALKNMGLK